MSTPLTNPEFPGRQSVDQCYRYGRVSILEDQAGTARMHLATSGGMDASRTPVAHPYFYAGFPANPLAVAQALLVVARVARTRFYVPPGMLAAILRAADPVITSTPAGLRFESFSACCGVHARLDIPAASLDTEFTASGVTNIDINPPLRQALAGLRHGEPLHLAIGEADVRVRTMDSERTEERVELPNRWLRGLCEVQASGTAMKLRHELGPAEAKRFIGSLPRTSSTGTVLWAARAARSLRTASRPARGAVCLAGPERLLALGPLLRFATGLRAYGPDIDADSLPAASCWVLDMPGARLSLTLSPGKSRGFSGEGGVLHRLSSDSAPRNALLLDSALALDSSIDIPDLGRRTGLRIPAVTDALAVLAISGQVGFDVAEGFYFHRPLPLDTAFATGLNSRLADAQRLASLGAVRPLSAAWGEPRGGADVRGFTVHSGGNEYVVRQRDGGTDSCSCPWFATHRDGRGPCKHILAARIAQPETGFPPTGASRTPQVPDGLEP
ncbi:SWIM zinc finger domain-containing protein [Paeniglutamicibacter sp. ZC-3]|uniref:SWIM zinc finger family protein n=1 Tax=Paeniglutamicibacter TaxID=1742990 RepID=UPI0021F78ABA|nr:MULTISPECIES: SWIM zinc finger family protein [Paeniglutamicibacter]MCV9994018.1 SWIM zinc finger domain-containing protein [Paeniglutamicibacter sp. ZC-3]MDO2935883.1 SWIM zinc finger family protein [Paeniglutamicibacter sulfureus]